jgi:hypothetical protein
MREDTRKRLERAIWADRLKKTGIALAIAGAIGAAFAYQSYDMKVENAVVSGTVTGIDPMLASNGNANGETLHVKLDDGRAINILALKSRHIKNGDHIEVTEHHHATGRVTHTLK